MKSIIIGAGTYAEVYLAYLQEAGVEVIGFVDDDPKYEGQSVRNVPVLGKISNLEILREKYHLEAAYCPLGNNKLRVKFLKMAKAIGYKIPNYIHPSVVISPDVSIGEGVYILLGTTIMPHTTIKDYVMILSTSILKMVIRSQNTLKMQESAIHSMMKM